MTYYQDANLDEVASKLASPLDLSKIASARDQSGNSLVIKEMPYQVGERFPLLADLATKPLLFLLRDPRLNIASRIEKKQAVGDSPFFPLIETGWDLIVQQIGYCRQLEIPYLIVDATDFRNAPASVFAQVFARLGLPFLPGMLSWQPRNDVELDNLAGAHSHLYRRVLMSSGIQPATEAIPALETFPSEHGFRDHVVACLEKYHDLCNDENRIIPA